MAADRRKSLLLALLLTSTLVTVGFLGFFPVGKFSDRAAAEDAFQQKDFAKACELAQRQLSQTPGDYASVMIGAEAAQNRNDLALAVKYLEQLAPRFDNATHMQAWRTRARLLEQLGRVTESCLVLQTTLQHVPTDIISRRWLSLTYSKFGYPFDAIQHAGTQLQNGVATISELALLARNGRGRLSRDQLASLHRRNPVDEMPIVGLVRSAQQQRNAADVESLLSEAERHISEPTLNLQCCQLAFALVTYSPNSQSDDIVERLRKIHQVPVTHPEAWMVTAEWAQRIDHPELHQRSLAEAVRLDRWNPITIHALANLLRFRQPELADRFSDLFSRLEHIERLAALVEASPDDANLIFDLATSLALIGRTAEASAWARIITSPLARSSWATDMILHPPNTEWTHPIDELAYVDAKPILNEQLLIAEQHSAPATAEELLFEDCAAEIGIDFQYDNGRPLTQAGLRMHQWTGGGVGVVDFDHDSWPDLYLTQGGELQQGLRSTNESDAVFRNARGQSFAQVTLPAEVQETGYGQGVATGDVDNDGFDDVYVANVGQNRLLKNQGDGTFVATDVLNGDSVWTTSVAIADLNGDGHPDLYDVNYLGGSDVYTKTCDHGGVQRICGPTDFAAERDRLLLSDGAGDFVAAADQDLPVGSDGRGMGLVVGQLTSTRGNQVYVANDESANQLFVRSEAGHFEDIALAVGVARDHYGRAQGSMGIASGDVDSNGTLDLFVTNYYAESNTLYRERQSWFMDATSSAQLAAAGYAQLGFGCQFLDVQGDGKLDLIVANGHLDDFTHEGQPYRMLPQLFLNRGSGIYETARTRGTFFSTPTLGRAVATLDWNRDGRCDFSVGHLDARVAVVTNQSHAEWPTVAVRLIGTASARIPAGAMMSAVATNLPQHRWLTAGDGYQCSNERLLRFSLPLTTQSYTVQWPDSTVQQVAPLRKGMFAVVQDRSTTYTIPR